MQGQFGLTQGASSLDDTQQFIKALNYIKESELLLERDRFNSKNKYSSYIPNGNFQLADNYAGVVKVQEEGPVIFSAKKKYKGICRGLIRKVEVYSLL